MARNVVIQVRIVALGFIARCLVCTGLFHSRLPWQQVHRADDLRCPTCGGSSEIDMDSLVTELQTERVTP